MDLTINIVGVYLLKHSEQKNVITIQINVFLGK